MLIEDEVIEEIKIDDLLEEEVIKTRIVTAEEQTSFSDGAQEWINF